MQVDEARVTALVDLHGVAVAPPASIHTVACDVLAPCALGGTLNATTIPELRCAAVCGSANNQLLEEADGDRLAAAGVLYVPDYVVNAGGIINIAEEWGGYDPARAAARIAAIGPTTAEVLRLAEAEGTTPVVAADRVAERRIAAARAHRHDGRSR